MAISCIVHTLISSPMAQIWILCSRGKNNISVTSERTVANCLCVPLINNTKTQENFKKNTTLLSFTDMFQQLPLPSSVCIILFFWLREFHRTSRPPLPPISASGSNSYFALPVFARPSLNSTISSGSSTPKLKLKPRFNNWHAEAQMLTNHEHKLSGGCRSLLHFIIFSKTQTQWISKEIR